MNARNQKLANFTESPSRSLTADAWYRLVRNKLAVVGLVVVVVIGLACLLGPFISGHDAMRQYLEKGTTGPSFEHWLGTDLLGRDLLSRILYGGRVSFAVGLLATIVSLSIGVTYGMVSGYVGGHVDRVMMRFVEILYAMPFIVFVIILVTYLGRQFWLIFFAIGAVEWLAMARIIRGQVLSLKEQAFVQASRSLGQSHIKIMVLHLLPNLLGIIMVYATLTVPSVMLLEAFISFLGLGVQAPMTSWGELIKVGAENMEEYPWLLIGPCMFFSLTLFSLNFLGDGLRDAFDPRAEKG